MFKNSELEAKRVAAKRKKQEEKAKDAKVLEIPPEMKLSELSPTQVYERVGDDQWDIPCRNHDFNNLDSEPTVRN